MSVGKTKEEQDRKFQLNSARQQKVQKIIRAQMSKVRFATPANNETFFVGPLNMTSRVRNHLRGYPAALRRFPPPYISNEEVLRLVSSASKLIVATEHSCLPFIPRRPQTAVLLSQRRKQRVVSSAYCKGTERESSVTEEPIKDTDPHYKECILSLVSSYGCISESKREEAGGKSQLAENKDWEDGTPSFMEDKETSTLKESRRKISEVNDVATMATSSTKSISTSEQCSIPSRLKESSTFAKSSEDSPILHSSGTSSPTHASNTSKKPRSNPRGKPRIYKSLATHDHASGRTSSLPQSRSTSEAGESALNEILHLSHFSCLGSSQTACKQCSVPKTTTFDKSVDKPTNYTNGNEDSTKSPKLKIQKEEQALTKSKDEEAVTKPCEINNEFPNAMREELKITEFFNCDEGKRKELRNPKPSQKSAVPTVLIGLQSTSLCERSSRKSSVNELDGSLSEHQETELTESVQQEAETADNSSVYSPIIQKAGLYKNVEEETHTNEDLDGCQGQTQNDTNSETIKQEGKCKEDLESEYILSVPCEAPATCKQNLVHLSMEADHGQPKQCQENCQDTPEQISLVPLQSKADRREVEDACSNTLRTSYFITQRALEKPVDGNTDIGASTYKPEGSYMEQGNTNMIDIIGLGKINTVIPDFSNVSKESGFTSGDMCQGSEYHSPVSPGSHDGIQWQNYSIVRCTAGLQECNKQGSGTEADTEADFSCSSDTESVASEDL
nr:PREDICTED: uncharacterized protein LOC106705533 [Latimeria chalumnae]|eukprot:XP_014350632.1 PREDICTED: uncharacterized protein LOC106705533 [Latimeria chalumnae]